MRIGLREVAPGLAVKGQVFGQQAKMVALLQEDFEHLPRFIATVEAIGRDLKHGNSLYRYIAPDDFGEPETSFTICTFWYIDALAAIGRLDEAREMFEILLQQRNHLGLLSEDLSFDGQAWGNFPQTYSHVGLVTAAMRLSRSWQEAS